MPPREYCSHQELAVLSVAECRMNGAYTLNS